ncbi:MAG TPA: 3-deoxy-8-phosphooctulonate synthase, partial [Dissulfurispiraceae bacterium]|nr:3-deoxy-8-phosphooctulonate synthase [Dissulfurispiraceae bacterium]
AKAAAAAGVDGIFMEVHPDPDSAKCDGPNMIPLDQVPGLLKKILALHTLTREAY